MEDDKTYLQEDDRLHHEYDDLSREELLIKLKEIEEQNRSDS